MVNHGKLVLAAVVATGCLLVVLSSASASKLLFSETAFRTVWRTLEFGEPEGTIGTIRCPVTLQGSFHSATIAKVERTLIGQVSGATVSTCTGGSVTVLSETLPWHVTYRGFAGTLPNITSVRLGLIGAAFRTHIRIVFEFFCLIRTGVESPALMSATVERAGLVTDLVPDATALIPATSSGGAGCPSSSMSLASPSTDGEVTLLESTAQWALRLTEAAKTAALGKGGVLNRMIVMTITNTTAMGGGNITINEIRLGRANPELYSINDANRCDTRPARTLAPDANCIFSVIQAPGGGNTTVEVKTEVGLLQKVVQ